MFFFLLCKLNNHKPIFVLDAFSHIFTSRRQILAIVLSKVNTNVGLNNSTDEVRLLISNSSPNVTFA